jgi:SNF2 family DNA or RNA helicase
VLPGWQRELAKWCGPSVRVCCFHGASSRARDDALDIIRQRGGVLLTTYGLITTCAERLNAAMGGDGSGSGNGSSASGISSGSGSGSGNGNSGTRGWDYIILDEGHRIKNPSIQLSKKIREIGAAHRLVVTGTPIQNSLDELWALFDFACAGRLFGAHKDFKREFEAPIVRFRALDFARCLLDSHLNFQYGLH